ncbi:MAG: protein of unknown function DUF3987 [Siphoviridae sp. ctdEk19]|nr:MAG: protein of unknown function DUF3987 [Siphoviridae sp. ctdEk19]
MARNFDNWLDAFCGYARFGEAPEKMYRWVGVSTLAGALRRKVWIDQYYFKWFPNFYIILVAPPGIVSKSTTAAIGMNLLRRVPNIRFGPDVVTWQALVTAFSEAAEAFELAGEWHTMSPITIESSEFGNLLNPADKEMVDLLVSLWDGKQGNFEKRTKGSGTDIVQNPWINLVACTTPSWIAGNFPEYMIGGGFTSRCVFVYAENKARYVAYPGLAVPTDLGAVEQRLVQDLEHISLNLAGPISMTPEAIAWGEDWYKRHFTTHDPKLDDERFGGYRARKQTHLHKLAMIHAIAQRDDLLIYPSDLNAAETMLNELEFDMPLVFEKIGQNEQSYYINRMISSIEKAGGMRFPEAYQLVHAQFPNGREFDDLISGTIRSGRLRLQQKGSDMWLLPAASNSTQ